MVNAGGPVDLPWIDEVPAAIMAWYPGQEFGAALADVLVGHSDPGGRLPITFPTSMDQTPTAGSVPGDGTILQYSEGLFIGHRWYSANDVSPALPFGHGLSYTEFRIDEPVVGRNAGRNTERARVVEVPVTNVGERSGKCVLQAYLQPEPQQPEPQQPGSGDRPRVLAGFAAVRLQPGEATTVAIELSEHTFRAWNTQDQRWEPLAGNHRLEIATSATEVVHTVTIT